MNIGNSIKDKVFNLFKFISFKIFNKSKFLIIVDDYRQKYPIKNAEYYCARKIYIFYLILSILKLNSNIKKNYFYSIFKSVNYKGIISNNLNVLSYNFKKYSKNSKLIFFQHSYIADYQIENYKKLYRNIEIDYFCVFDQRHQNIFSKIVKSKFIIIGSFNNNFIKIYKNKNRQKQINYISEYRGKLQTENSIFFEKKIIKKLHNFCLRYGYKLLISLNSSRLDKTIKRDKEVNYFLNIEKSIEFNNSNSYQNSYDSSITLVMSSNIGLELLSRGIPTLYFNELQKIDKKFDNPYFKNFSNFFIDTDLCDEEFAKKIFATLSNKLNNQHTPIRYDKDNIEFFKILKSL